MTTNAIQKVLSVFGILALFVCAPTRAQDWAEKSFELIDGGTMTMSYPLSWGDKPAYQLGNSVANLTFGPYGPKSKPIFFVNIHASVAIDSINEASLKSDLEQDVEFFRNSALENDIPISDFEGSQSFGYYFSITDREPKRGELDYLTLAAVASDHLLVKVYLFSSDGAPDFGADAMQMMRSISYIPPPVEETEEVETEE